MLLRSDGKAIMDIKQAADFLQISPATVRNWIKHNYLTPVSQKSKLIFSVQDVHSLKQDIAAGRIIRLRKRANKDKSVATFLPLEYLSDIERANDIENAVNLIFENSVPIDEGLFFFALNLLSREGLLPSFRSAQELLAFDGDFFYRKQIKEELKKWAENINFKSSPDFQEEALKAHIPQVQDFLGTLYQTLRAEGNKAQAGAYYTPLQIVKDITDNYIVDSNAQVLDPCCGSGQFLLVALDRLMQIKGKADVLENIWGVDIDDIAIRIARINVLIKCKEQDNISPHIYCRNTLLEDNGDIFATQEKIVKDNFFDLIITNPPWGAKLSNNELQALSVIFPYIQSGESFSYFIAKGIKALKSNGILSYILPESFLNVKMHVDIRRRILEQMTVKKITYLSRVFKNVFTPVVRLDIQKNPPQDNHLVKIENDKVFDVGQRDFLKNDGLIFHINLDNEGSAILNKLCSQPHTTLSDKAEWALGIVTGDNEKFLSKVPSEGHEGIIKGKDILKFFYRTPAEFIKFEPEKFQQVASTGKYRAKEKLIYKFISRELVFAYDDNQMLTLNSANILIPKCPTHSTKVILGFFNSSLYQFIFQKKINSIKVLRSHIETLPLPHWSENTMQILVDYVDQLLKPEVNDGQRLEIFEALDNFIMSAWGLMENEKTFILKSIDSSKNNFLRN